MRLNVTQKYIACLSVSAFGAAELHLTWNYTDMMGCW